MGVERLAEIRDWLFDDQRDLEINDIAYPKVIDSDWSPLLSRAHQLLDGFEGRLGIHGPCIDLTLKATDPKVRSIVSERLRRGLEFGGELGATHMVVHSPFEFMGASPFLPHSTGFGLAGEIELVHATLAEVVPLAQQVGCTLVVENVFDLSPAPLLALVRSFESEHVRMSLDTGHAFIAYRRGGPPPDQWVREAGDLLGHLHLQDTDGNWDRHWAPGEGEIDWFALFEALGQLDDQPRLVVELRDQSRRRIEQGALWLARQGLAR